MPLLLAIHLVCLAVQPWEENYWCKPWHNLRRMLFLLAKNKTNVRINPNNSAVTKITISRLKMHQSSLLLRPHYVLISLHPFVNPILRNWLIHDLQARDAHPTAENVGLVRHLQAYLSTVCRPITGFRPVKVVKRNILTRSRVVLKFLLSQIQLMPLLLVVILSPRWIVCKKQRLIQDKNQLHLLLVWTLPRYRLVCAPSLTQEVKCQHWMWMDT